MGVDERGGGGSRAQALDALRGYAILTMALSGLVPWGTLPQWMYHAQLIVPSMKFDGTVPGLTWVDLVFPFFLFSMGAAFPLALARRTVDGAWSRLLLRVAGRGAMLGFFAIYVQHITPTTIANPDGPRAWWLALLGFALLFPLLAQLPEHWTWAVRAALRCGGWIGCLALLAFLNWREGESVAGLAGRIVAVSDIIIVVLANTAVAGSLVWLATREQLAGRVAVMIALVGLRLAAPMDGWVKTVWDWSPAPWIYKLYYLQYLLIVVPGTIAGDLLLRSRIPSSENGSAWHWSRAAALALLLLTTIVVVSAGLQARLVEQTVLAAAGLALVAIALTLDARGPGERLVRSLIGWGVLWLAIGLIFEPYEGGIKKDKSTLSYYFVTSGLAFFSLAALTLCFERLRAGKPLTLLSATGRNPMLAYAAIRSLLRPLVHLSGLESWVASLSLTAWQGAGYAAAKTLALAVVVGLFTRMRVQWRS